VSLTSVGLSFCVTVAHTEQYGIEVKGGSTIPEKVHIARTVVTEERLNRLKGQIKDRIPTLSNAQLSGMGLTWSQTQIRSLNGGEPETVVFVHVSIPTQPGVDGKVVLETAAHLLEPELNGNIAATSDGHPVR
jgi:hypothetical protein